MPAILSRLSRLSRLVGFRRAKSVIIVTLEIVSCQEQFGYNAYKGGEGMSAREKKTKVMTIRMTERTKEAIDREAARHDWTASKTAEKILTAWAERQEHTELQEQNITFQDNAIQTVNIS